MKAVAFARIVKQKTNLVFSSESTMHKPNFENIQNELENKYNREPDPWGLKPDCAVRDLKLIYPFYRYYFDVKVHLSENQNADELKNFIAISNHTGQIPLDALLICSAFALEFEKPIVLRPMIERFLNGLPFLGLWSTEGGAVLGDRQNCIELLKRGESVLVFPEGVTGIAKSTKNHYQLQKFTRGFVRMALTVKTPILPLAVIGAEEFYPFVYHSKLLPKLFKVPALPLSLNLIPLPSPVDIYIGELYHLPTNVNADSSDHEIDAIVHELEARVKKLTDEGLKNKRTIPKRGLNIFKNISNQIIRVKK